ncbi:hypothetical protein [Microtetraspora fusca]|uniref:hypothetical protein n=1 Tax=Microtetraspora fusca TaxID=1997 RepID=UPI000A7DFE8D|nr:hypothetical protein [Microtetraspora fusca]
MINPTRQVAREKVAPGALYRKHDHLHGDLPIKVNDYGERGVAGGNTSTSTTEPTVG